MEGLDIRPEQKVYLNWFHWCKALLNNMGSLQGFLEKT